MPNALLDETRSRRIDLAFPTLGQLRASRTTYDVLAAEKPSDQSWADFTIRALVAFVVMKRMVAGEMAAANSVLVRLGMAPADEAAKAADDATSLLTNVRTPANGQGKPLAKAGARP